MLNLAFNCPKKIEEFNRTGENFHCSSCDKKIHDFRDESNETIAKVLGQNNDSTCGIVRPAQLSNRYHFKLSNAFLKAFVFVFIMGFGSQVLQAQHLDNTLATPEYVTDVNLRILKGKVTDEYGEAIPFAKVILKIGDESYYTLSDFDGEYSFNVDVDDSSYMELMAVAMGYDTMLVVQIFFGEKQVTYVDIMMYNEELLSIGIIISNEPPLIPRDPYDFNRTVIRFDD